ncbi:MAG: hypothetical protein QG656_2174, partial [Candidatus Hydrogenedentes bacterium]|nr:hypothetical protein [Candidatus Hydrogenedentota bacterium]
MTNSTIRRQYSQVKETCATSYKDAIAGEAIHDLVKGSLRFLTRHCKQIDLISLVPGKSYVTYKKGNIVARPANANLFVCDENAIAEYWNEWLANTIGPVNFAKLSYTAALAPCLAMELFDRQNKKGPATYFEC